jgi:acyl dehydratase
MPDTHRTWPIGKRYDGGVVVARAEHIAAFARATGDENPAFFGPDAVAPLVFHMRLFRDLAFETLLDPELSLDVMRLVHGEHDVTFHAPIHAGDRVAVDAVLDDVAEKASGTIVVLRYTASVLDLPVLQARSSFFVRGASRRTGEATSRSTPSLRPDPDVERRIEVAPDQSYRYADASLDTNPIHVDPDFARAVGFPDVILQGLATMAMTGAAATDALAGGDPLRVQRFNARFVRPVFNGAHLRVGFWKRSDGSFDLETTDALAGTLHASGVVTLREVAREAGDR